MKNFLQTHRIAGSSPERKVVTARPAGSGKITFWQVVRFGIVGLCNTAIDVLVLNLLLWRFPTSNTNLLLLYNSAAYLSGAFNSYIFNKYWTFRHRQPTTGRELLRFALVNGASLLCNNSLLWSAASVLHLLFANRLLWANLAKLSAIIGTATFSYLAMRLWVFLSPPPRMHKRGPLFQTSSLASAGTRPLTTRGLSVVLPAWNEEAVIARTVKSVVETLSILVPEYEVIVVDDGSQDRTGQIADQLAEANPRIRVVHNQPNRGYGGALRAGFQAASKELTFFMDADGQFDIREITKLLAHLEEADAVLGYREQRQDPPLRIVNAWGWKLLMRLFFGLRVRDIDCAFKLYPTALVRRINVQAQGAMVNTEMLGKLKRLGYHGSRCRWGIIRARAARPRAQTCG